MLLTPVLFILYDRVIAPRYSVTQEREADTMPGDRNVIIAGAGRMGGLVSRVLMAGGIESTVIDYNARKLAVLERFGTRFYYGDAARPDLLHAAGIGRAHLLVVAIDEREQINTIVSHVIQHHPAVHVVARAVDRDHVYELWQLGCRDIIRETFDSTMRMSRSVFEATGVDRSTAQRMVDKFNELDREAMVEVAEAYDVSVPLAENDAYIDLIRSRRGDWQGNMQEHLAQIRAAGAAQQESDKMPGDA